MEMREWLLAGKMRRQRDVFLERQREEIFFGKWKCELFSIFGGFHSESSLLSFFGPFFLRFSENNALFLCAFLAAGSRANYGFQEWDYLALKMR